VKTARPRRPRGWVNGTVPLGRRRLRILRRGRLFHHVGWPQWAATIGMIQTNCPTGRGTDSLVHAMPLVHAIGWRGRDDRCNRPSRNDLKNHLFSTTPSDAHPRAPLKKTSKNPINSAPTRETLDPERTILSPACTSYTETIQKMACAARRRAHNILSARAENGICSVPYWQATLTCVSADGGYNAADQRAAGDFPQDAVTQALRLRLRLV
jgi:hypothetical protein